MKSIIALLSSYASAQSMFEFNSGNHQVNNRLTSNFEKLMQGDFQEVFKGEDTYVPFINKKMDKIKGKEDRFARFERSVVHETEDEKLILYKHMDAGQSCVFKLDLEQKGSLDMRWQRTLLSNLETGDENANSQFLRVGLGNIDRIPFIENGDIQGYPIAAMPSQHQTCVWSEQSGAIVILSTIQAPKRSNPWSETTTLKFHTVVQNMAPDADGNRNVQVITTPVLPEQVDIDFIEYIFDSPPSEKIYGFGLQFTETNFKGKKVDIATSEGGVGRGLQPLTDENNVESKQQGGTTMTTYSPAYAFASSLRRGVVLNLHTEIGHVDFERSNTTYSTVLWHSNDISMTVVSGNTMKQVVTGISAVVGRMKKLPAWTQQGAVVGLQGGETGVTQQYNFLKSQGIKMKAVWMQDWVGRHKFPEGVRLLWNWQLNKETYPNWDSMIANWATDGVRPMVYINPYFANLTSFAPNLRTQYYVQGNTQGVFVRDPKDGETLNTNSISIEFAQVDFTNPAGWTWIKDIIKNNMLKEANAVGWMHDFGEYVPLKVQYNTWNRDSSVYHNKYPLDWAKAASEAVKELNEAESTTKYDDTVWFMRAGATNSPKYTSVFWMGDQMPTLDKFDGMHSALIGLLNGGMVGFSLGHSDLGGYTSINNTANLQYFKRTPEVLTRWMEMSCFSDALFRTHPSNNPAFNTQIWDNAQIAGQMKKFTDVFVALGDYRMQLMTEMETNGIPPTRSLMLEFDNTDYDIDDQFMLGSKYMVAPVVEVGAISRSVFFPEGTWTHYFTKQVVIIGAGGRTMMVDAPLGTPAAYEYTVDPRIAYNRPQK